MWGEIGKAITYSIAGYFILGQLMAWKWLLEARIKCIDSREPMWAEYLNSLKGITSFSILATIFWLPSIVSNFVYHHKRLNRVRKKTAMSWPQAFHKAIELYQQLQAWRRNEIE
jgi:hypothetical protein